MSTEPSETSFWRSPIGIGLAVFLVAAAYFLWVEHRPHVIGALPYLLLLACVGMHFFMHGGHGGHGSHKRDDKRDGDGL